MNIQKGQRALLFMQIFTTLAFSVLYSTLLLYATQMLHLTDTYATSLVGSFIAFNFSLHVLGSYIGGRLLSYRALFLIGQFLVAIGCIILSMTTVTSLIVGLSIFLAGVGLYGVCINCMLTGLYSPHDKRRESAFLWNYSGMNVGFFIGFTVSGIFQLNQKFHTLFILTACGSLVSCVIALLNWKYLADRDTILTHSKNHWQRFMIAIVLIIALVGLLTWLIHHSTFSNILILFVGLFVAIFFMAATFQQSHKEYAKKIWAFLILILSSLVFWTLYQMAPMGLTLFYNRNVEHVLFGFTVPPQWIQNINTFVIVIGGPLIAKINQVLRKKGRVISLPFQFSTALLLIGIGFLFLPFGIYLADSSGMSSIIWIVICYLFQSTGELFISPIGYAMIGQLMPSKLQSLSMGTVMMVTGVAAVLSNYSSQSAFGVKTENPLATNPSYSFIFLILGLCAIASGIIIFFLRKYLHHLIQEKGTLKEVEPAPYNTTESGRKV